jgi:hypothetical protein
MQEQQAQELLRQQQHAQLQQQYLEEQQRQAQQSTSSQPQQQYQQMMQPSEREVTGVNVPSFEFKNTEMEKDPKTKVEKKKKRKLAFAEKPLIEQKAMSYSIVSDLLHLKSNITVAQLLNIPQFKNELKKALTPRRVRRSKPRDPTQDKKGKKREMMVGAASTNTPMICKGQVGQQTINIIVDSGSSISIISKRFADYLKRKPNQASTKRITGIHGDQRASLGVITDVPVDIEGVIVSTEMEVIDTTAYTLVLGNDWLTRASARIDFNPPRLTITDGRNTATIECKNTITRTTPEVIEDDEEETDEDDDSTSSEEEYEEIGLTSLSLVATEDESPDQHYYSFSPWGIEIDTENFTWEEYHFMNQKYNPWLTNQKYRHQHKHWFSGPDKSCWCRKKLKSENDNCEECQDDYERWCTIQVLPIQEVRPTASYLVTGGTEKLENNPHRQMVEELLNKYPKIAAKDMTEIGRTNLYRHKIETGNAREIRQYPYRLSPLHSRFLKEEIERLLQQGLIVPSESPWTSPALVVGKANGQMRLVVDYRKLNQVTKPDAYPLPKIAEMLDALAHCEYFSTLDLTSGFWQVAMDPDDQEKTAFTTHFGTYEFTVMPFGLMNAPATFQRLMTRVLYDVAWKFALVYMDDIIIYSKTTEDHRSHLEKVFQLLLQAGLKLNPDKCDFYQTQILFLGHMVSKEGIKPNPTLVNKIKNCPRPVNRSKVRSFLGLASYYRRFIKDFSAIARPLYNLTKLDEPFCWTEDCEQAYNYLRNCLTTHPIVIYPNLNKPFILHTDASNYAIGAVLAQNDDKGHERVIAYASRVLSVPESNYTVTEKECLAVIWATKYFHHFLQGQEFSIVTDHEAIPWLKKHKSPKGRLARWIIHLSEYEPYTILRRKGSSHTNADALSRLETNPADSLLSLTY